MAKGEIAAFNEMINSNPLILVDFYATWCGPCKAMTPILQNLKEEIGDDLLIVKIDTDKYQQLSAQYQIRSVPTLMLYKNGKQVWKQAGGMQLAELKRLIASHQ